MVFSSLLFLFIYLPFVLGLYFILPPKCRNGFLFLANLLFYGWGEPVFVFVMILSVCINYGFGKFLEIQKKHSTLWFTVALCLNLSLLFLFKYADFFREILRTIIGIPIGASLGLALPIGISFYTFQAISYLADIYRKQIKAQNNIITFGTYLSFFPQLIAGPIVRYSEMAEALEERKVTLAEFSNGIRIFIIGLSKKVLIANEMGVLWNYLQSNALNDGFLAAWIGITAFALQIYFDFSGYSDMARGLGKMFGFELPFNFRYPYSVKSITDFWRRWHMTLTRWFKDYIYIPLGGNRKGTIHTIINLFIVWCLTGLWHGAAYNFLIWGIFWFCLLVGEKFIWGKVLAKSPKFFQHCYALFFILTGWVIFAVEGLPEICHYFGAMFSLKNGILSGDSLVYTISYLPLLLIAALASTALDQRVWRRIKEKSYQGIISVTVIMVLFLLSVAALVNQSFNPFLYFRF